MEVCELFNISAEGKGIPPGVKPRVCKTCNGSGTVCMGLVNYDDCHSAWISY